MKITKEESRIKPVFMFSEHEGFLRNVGNDFIVKKLESSLKLREMKIEKRASVEFPGFLE